MSIPKFERVSIVDICHGKPITHEQILATLHHHRQLTVYFLSLEPKLQSQVLDRIAKLIGNLSHSKNSVLPEVIQKTFFGLIFEAMMLPFITKYSNNLSNFEASSLRGIKYEVVSAPDTELYWQSACELVYGQNFQIRQQQNTILLHLPENLNTDGNEDYHSVLSLPDYLITKQNQFGTRVRSVVEVSAKNLPNLSTNQIHQVLRGELAHLVSEKEVEQLKKTRNKLIQLAFILTLANRSKFKDLQSISELIFITQSRTNFPLEYLQNTWKYLAKRFVLTPSQEAIQIVHLTNSTISCSTIDAFAQDLYRQLL